MYQLELGWGYYGVECAMCPAKMLRYFVRAYRSVVAPRIARLAQSRSDETLCTSRNTGISSEVRASPPRGSIRYYWAYDKKCELLIGSS
jgi:hypothetical protein